jgi:tetratricopeptide (TPR) repeat protein
VLSVLALGVGCVAMATPSKERVDAIWSYAKDRIDRQTDVWFDDGDFPATIAVLKVSSILNPHDYDVVTNLGWMQENIEQWDEAVKTYERYRADNPNDPDRALPIAQYYYMKKQYEKVPPLLESSIAGDAKPHANIFRILGSSYEKLGKLKDAERVLTKYLSIAPNDGQAKVNLARIERKLKGGTR